MQIVARASILHVVRDPQRSEKISVRSIDLGQHRLAAGVENDNRSGPTVSERAYTNLAGSRFRSGHFPPYRHAKDPAFLLKC